MGLEGVPIQIEEARGILADERVRQREGSHDWKLDDHMVQVEANAEPSDWGHALLGDVVEEVAVRLHMVMAVEGVAGDHKVNCTRVAVEEVDTVTSAHTCHRQEETDDLKGA